MLDFRGSVGMANPLNKIKDTHRKQPPLKTMEIINEYRER